MQDKIDRHLKNTWNTFKKSEYKIEPLNEEYKEIGYNSAAICRARGVDPKDAGKWERCRASVRASYDNPEGRKEYRKKLRKSGKQLDEENLPGGLADNIKLEEISKMHGVTLSDILEQYTMGIKVEFEHTNDEYKASEIAKDQLVEDPYYYSKLEKMESGELDHLVEDDQYEDEIVIIHDPQEMANDIISEYEKDPEITDAEAIQEIKEDIKEEESELNTRKTRLMPKIENWNTAWVNSNRSGIKGSMPSSSIGIHNLPFANYDEAEKIFNKEVEEKEEELLDMLGFVGYTHLINMRRGKKTNLTKSKQRSVSPFLRDDILRSAIFGKNHLISKQKLQNITNKLEKGEEIQWEEFKEIADLMDGPSGTFLKYLIFGVESDDPLIRTFKEIHEEKKNIYALQRRREAKQMVLDHFENKSQKLRESKRTDFNPLYEGLKSWKKFTKGHYKK